jgi:hypothetical protein
MAVWCVPAPSAADWLIAPFVGVVFAGNTNIVEVEIAAGKAKTTYGGSVALLGEGILGVEGEFAWTPGFYEGDVTPQLVSRSRVTTLMGNVIIALPESVTGFSPRPFVSGGLGLMRSTLEDVLDLFSHTDHLLALDVGGGFLGFFSPRVGVRGDLRYFKSISTGDEQTPAFGATRLSYWRLSAGVVLRY